MVKLQEALSILKVYELKAVRFEVNLLNGCVKEDEVNISHHYDVKE